ncbi:ribose-5-phosphate isomerase RpiA [Tundrisphaera sp. TA3]|uniref:ribose-5-phosphate isomerase RpiA n=1 Tax=Tundrisphaera sp. TA3 TaxID=3435775 RepID=UPI003EB9C28D
MSSAETAIAMIRDGDAIGLGTGRAATRFVEALGERVRAGLKVRGVPTSAATAALATRLGIPLTTLDDVAELAITFDGADEVDPNLDLIKGLGGALVREKIVAASSRRLVILVGPGKEVDALGSRGKLPVEVVPFGVPLALRKLAALGLPAEIRPGPDGSPFVTDNGNHVLDCHASALADPRATETAIHTIPGVVDTGLFLGMADTVLIEDEAGSVRVLRRGPA